jgi:IclR family pca regulon transcriptional regulator
MSRDLSGGKGGASETLVQAFQILQAFTASEPELTLVELAARAGLDSSVAFHLVQTLVVLGYVERINGSKRFQLTLKPLELGFKALVQTLEASGLSRPLDRASYDLTKCSVSEFLTNIHSLSEARKSK